MADEIHVHVHLHLPDVDRRLDRIAHDIVTVLGTQGVLMADLTGIQAEVEANGAVDASAEALLTSLAAKIDELSTDPAALADLANSLRDQSSALAAAVVANTPAAPEPPADQNPPADVPPAG